MKRDLETLDYSYANSGFSQNNVFSIGDGDFPEATEPILIKFIPHILHVDTFHASYNCVKIEIFTFFFAKNREKTSVLFFFVSAILLFINKYR